MAQRSDGGDQQIQAVHGDGVATRRSAIKREGTAVLCSATAKVCLETQRSSKAVNGGGAARQGQRRTWTLSEACAGSLDAGMQDGGGAGPATRAAGGDV